jgi:hypothetical protein
LLQPQSKTVPLGASVTNSILVAGSSPLQVQWRFNGQNIPGATTSALPLTGFRLADVGAYSVLVSNTYGVATSSNAQLSAASQLPSNLARGDFWVTDGPVNAAALDNGVLYLGGSFNFVRPNVGTGLALDANTGAVIDSVPKVNGTVSAAVADGVGGWFIGGSFTAVGGIAATNLAHIRGDNSVDGGWKARTDGAVNCIVVVSNQVFLGGDFSSVNGQSRHCLAAVTASNGTLSGWNLNPNNPVQVMTTQGNTLFIGGWFSSVGAQAQTYLAAVDVITGLPKPFPSVNTFINSIASSPTTVYVGFQCCGAVIGGQSRGQLAAVDIASGTVTPWAPPAPSNVFALAVDGNTVYAAGYGLLAAFDAVSGVSTSWQPNAADPWGPTFYALAVSGGDVYVGGAFTSLGGQTRYNLAVVDKISGAILSSNLVASGTVNALAACSNRVYAGGSIQMGGVARQNLAALEVSTGMATSWNPRASGSVAALVVTNGTVFVGGSFTNIGGQARQHIAALDEASGAATPWNPQAVGVTSSSPGYGQVNVLAADGGLIYAGGSFTNIGGLPRTGLAALDAITGIATAWDPQLQPASYTPVINALAVAGTTLFAGGTFTNIGGKLRQSIAALDVGTGLAIAWNPAPTNGNWVAGRRPIITALAASGSILYVGGNFTFIGGQVRSNAAALDTSTGLATPWNPDPYDWNNPQNLRVMSLLPAAQPMVTSLTVYLGGTSFSVLGGYSRAGLGAVDPALGNLTAWNPGACQGVTSLLASSNRVYALGGFTQSTPIWRPYVAAFDLGAPAGIVVQPQSIVSARGTPASFSVTATSPIPVSYQWLFNGLSLTGAVGPSLSITALPTNSGNYQVVITGAYGSTTSVVATLTVLQPAPVVTWATPAPITYGVALSASQLNATASVPGTNAYSPPAGTVLDAGTHRLSVIFTPTDAVDYSSVTDSVSLVVLPAPLTVTAANASRAYGQTNPIFTGAITGLRNGDNITATYSCSASTSSPVGTYPIVPSLVDPDEHQTNYSVSLVNGTLTVTPPVIQSVMQSGNSFTFTWSTRPTQVYQIQYTTNLTGSAWSNFGGPIVATNSTTTASDPITNSQVFYRVVLLP